MVPRWRAGWREHKSSRFILEYALGLGMAVKLCAWFGTLSCLPAVSPCHWLLKLGCTPVQQMVAPAAAPAVVVSHVSSCRVQLIVSLWNARIRHSSQLSCCTYRRPIQCAAAAELTAQQFRRRSGVTLVSCNSTTRIGVYCRSLH
jgi:hypothetical protein